LVHNESNPNFETGEGSKQGRFVSPHKYVPCARKLFEKINRLEYRAERCEILSPTQNGFRKDREIRDCVVINGNSVIV
jgi:hypothetical protein